MTKIVEEIATYDIGRLEEVLGEIATTAKSGHSPKEKFSGIFQRQRARFAEQANNIEERRTEDEDAANIFAVMLEFHHKQVNTTKEANTIATQMAQMQMKTMTEQQQQQMAQFTKTTTSMQSNQQQQCQPKEDKENSKPQTKGRGDTHHPNDAGKSNCPHCKRIVFHKLERCL